MGTLLARNTRLLVTMDDARREISGGEMLIRDGFIEAIGERNSLAQQADKAADLSGHIVLPGFVILIITSINRSTAPILHRKTRA